MSFLHGLGFILIDCPECHRRMRVRIHARLGPVGEAWVEVEPEPIESSIARHRCHVEWTRV